MTASERVTFARVEGADELFTPEFVELLAALHDRFAPRIRALLAKRAEVLQRALKQGIMPMHLPVSEINTGDWQVPRVPENLIRFSCRCFGTPRASKALSWPLGFRSCQARCWSESSRLRGRHPRRCTAG